MFKRLRKLRPFRAIRRRVKIKQRMAFLSPRLWRTRMHDMAVYKSKSSKIRINKRIKPFFSFLGRRLKYLFQMIQRAWRGFRWMTRSLWFRLMGAFAVVILLMLIIVSSVISNVTSRAFNQYLYERDQYLRDVIPTLDETAVNIEQPNGQVILEDVIEVPLLELLAPSLPENIGLNFLSEVQDAATTAVVAAGMMSLLLGTLLFRQITRPMGQMRRASQALAAGDLTVRVPVRSQDELGKVAEAFNQMATEIGHQEQMRRQMVADVAHELRTPLTVMKANLEGMLDGLLEPNQAELRELHDEVHQLSRLIDDLRLLSLVDSGQLSLFRQKADVRHVITAVVSRLKPLAEERSVKLVDDVPPQPILLMIDEGRLQQALTNLIANGIRHTPKGGRVRVTAVFEKRMVYLSVIDSGPGIAPEDLPHVFDRFWRGDKSRSRHSGGSGLGLAIVKQIVELHEGQVTAVSPQNSGAIFTISLPINKFVH